MNKILNILAIGAATAFLAGCDSQGLLDQDVEATYIEVSQEIINLSASATSQEVEVTTNVQAWQAREASEYDWLDLMQAGSSLVISAGGNAEGNQRTAYVIIEAGGQSQRIAIHQEAATGSQIILSEQRLKAPNLGGEYQLTVSATTEQWQIEGDDLYPWIQVSKAQHGLQVRVSPNGEARQRIGKFYVTTQSSLPQEVIITQAGRVDYPFPYLPDMPINQADVLRDAQARGFFFLKKEVNPQIGESYYYFNPGDQFGSEVFYRFKKGVARYLSFVVESEGTQYGDSPEFDAFLTDQGFEKYEDKINLQAHIVRYHKAYPHYTVFVTASVIAAADRTRVSYVIKDKQPKPMESFAKIPYRNLSLFDKGKTFSDVKQWEESEGECIERSRTRGTDNPNVIARAEFLSVTKCNSHFSSIYYFNESEPVGELFQRVDIYREVSRALWQDSEGTYHVTEEMLQMLTQEGFEMRGRPKTGESQEWISFVDDKRRLAMLFTAVTQPTGEQFLGISFFFIPEQTEGQSIQTLALSNAHRAIKALR